MLKVLRRGWVNSEARSLHDRLTDDGLTQWHPAFLSLGKTLEECAEKYKGFCRRYKPRTKTQKKSHWGSKLLAGVSLKPKSKKNKSRFTVGLVPGIGKPRSIRSGSKVFRANGYNSE